METTQEREYYAQLGRNIRAAREAAGLTQEDVATSVGLSRISIVYFEKGTNRPAVHTLVDISKTLGKGLIELLPIMDSRVDSRPLAEQEWILGGLHLADCRFP